MHRAILLLSACVVVACSKDKPADPTPSPSAAPVSPAPNSPAPIPATPVVVFKEGLATPESVLYDDVADEYLVSNVNGDPLAVDGNGFITRLTPDGKVKAAKSIDKLDAPKGMCFLRGNLYVSDISRVRIFDRASGAPKGEIRIPNGTFVNDVAIAAFGRVVVSDTGTVGNDAVYAIEKDDKTLTTIAKGKELGGPNGLFSVGDRILVVGYGSGELYTIDPMGKREVMQKLPKAGLDGIVGLPGGELLISSWEAGGIYRGRPTGQFKLVLEGVKAPADIGWDAKRKWLLVPLFNDNEVRVYQLE